MIRYNIPGSYSFTRRALFMLLMLCSSEYSFAQAFIKKGNVVTYRGNTFELSPAAYDTIVIHDDKTGKDTRNVINKGGIPIKINGAQIYRSGKLAAPPMVYIESGPLGDYIFRELREELSKLPDGNYTLAVNNIVVDDVGKVVYYHYDGLKADNKKIKVPVKVAQSITARLDILMIKAAPFRPGQITIHRNVPVLTDITFDKYTVQVRSHKATILMQ